MKKWFYKAIIATTAAIWLTGCMGTAFAPANNSSTQKSLQTSRQKVRTTKNTKQSSSSIIALNDFSSLNLSLNNQQVTEGNLWEKIGQGFKIPDQEDRPEVQAQIRWFMAHPGYLQRTTERARAYLFIVYQEVHSRGLPTELVLLPINESGYYPFSYSVTGATGIWQLMPGTANDFGLKHNFWYDGRRDIFDSTNAALDYLTYLANYFNGDWLLAIAAYDTGEGNIQNAIARNIREGKPTDFWSLRVAAETQSYVPRLLALAAIISHPDKYPIQLPAVDAKPVVAPVHIDKQIKLTDAARLAGISVNQLKVLNPGLSRTTTDPTGGGKLLLPIDSVDSFKANLDSLAPTTETETYGRYRVQHGDTLRSIANRFGITEEDIRQANGLLGRHVSRGMVLQIPNVTENFKPNTSINLDQASLNLNAQKPQNDNTSEKSAANNAQTSATTDTNAVTSSKTSSSTDDTSNAVTTRHVIKHQVQRGETLSSIAIKFHTNVPSLEHLNPGISHKPLKPGQVIIVGETNRPLNTKPTQAHTTKKTHHSKSHKH